MPGHSERRCGDTASARQGRRGGAFAVVPQACPRIGRTLVDCNGESKMLKSALLVVFAVSCLVPTIGSARADDLPCVSTTFRFIGKNDRVCISAFDDPKVPGVACHVSQARTGGLSGQIRL